MNKQIDILLVTYNQSQFIQQALDGIMMQRLDKDVKMRIIVADDSSTDSTLDIIKKHLGEKCLLASGNEAEVTYMPGECNLGIAQNYKRAIAATTAEYVAILEGDDYWTDAYRLQKHVDYLSTHKDCVMTVNEYVEYSQERSEWAWKPEERKYLFLREMIANYCLGNLSARVYQGEMLREVEEKVFEYGEKQRGEATDYYITIDMLRHGYGYVLNEVMSVYRVGTHANISKREMTNIEELNRGKLCSEQVLEMLGDTYIGECKQIYRNAIEMTTEENQNRCVQVWSNYIPPCVAKFIWKTMPRIWYKLKYCIRQCIPNSLYHNLLIR